MNNAQRVALSEVDMTWYGLWTGAGWLMRTDGEMYWGPRSVMAAYAKQINDQNRHHSSSRVVAKAFPEPEGDVSQAVQVRIDEPPVDTSFRW